MSRRILRTTIPVLALALAAGAPPRPAAAQAPPRDSAARPRAPMVQPGAPDEATRTFDAGELSELSGSEYTAADVRFMQGMILHHAQALEMTALVPAHATTDAVRRMALRMRISQRDEIGLMARWLRERGHDVPEWEDAVAGGTARTMHAHGSGLMPGMLTPDQMAELRAARGTEFDRRFLELMIQHHGGAIVMIRDLLARGGGQEAEIDLFASHVDADQTAEIRRMQGVLDRLP